MLPKHLLLLFFLSLNTNVFTQRHKKWQENDFSFWGGTFRLKWMSAVCKPRVPKERSFGVENLVRSELQLCLKASKVQRIVCNCWKFCPVWIVQCLGWIYEDRRWSPVGFTKYHVSWESQQCNESQHWPITGCRQGKMLEVRRKYKRYIKEVSKKCERNIREILQKYLGNIISCESEESTS